METFKCDDVEDAERDAGRALTHGSAWFEYYNTLASHPASGMRIPADYRGRQFTLGPFVVSRTL